MSERVDSSGVDTVVTDVDQHGYNKDNIPICGSSSHDTEILVEGKHADVAGVPLSEGDFFGYQSDGTMVVVKGAPGPTDQSYDRFAEEASEELDLEVAVYLDGGSLDHPDAVSGEEMYELSEGVLEESPDLKVTDEWGYTGVAPVDNL